MGLRAEVGLRLGVEAFRRVVLAVELFGNRLMRHLPASLEKVLPTSQLRQDFGPVAPVNTMKTWRTVEPDCDCRPIRCRPPLVGCDRQRYRPLAQPVRAPQTCLESRQHSALPALHRMIRGPNGEAFDSIVTRAPDHQEHPIIDGVLGQQERREELLDQG